MKIIFAMIVLGFIIQPLRAEFVLPPEIASGIAHSNGGESGGFGIKGANKELYDQYISKHWKEIADHIEDLPPGASEPGFSFIDNQAAIDFSATNFAASCEILPPLEYLDFLDRWLDLYQQKRVSYRAFSRYWSGTEQKEDFLSVNWAHPRVKRILERTLELVPPEETSFRGLVESIAAGELADGYLFEKPDSYRPQTLPGIKLQRPWASLIKKAEKLSGIKYPPDPEFETPKNERPSKSNFHPNNQAPSASAAQANHSKPWIIAILLLCVAIYGAWKIRRSPARHNKTKSTSNR